MSKQINKRVDLVCYNCGRVHNIKDRPLQMLCSDKECFTLLEYKYTYKEKFLHYFTKILNWFI